MPFKAKPIITVGSGEWEVRIPRPPRHATHVRLTTRDEVNSKGHPKKSTLPLKDFACFKGVAGHFQYIRMDRKRKVLEEYSESWFWTGNEVEGIDVNV